MSISVSVPTQLRTLTDGEACVEAAAGVLVDIIEDLESRFPGLRARLLDEGGHLRRFVNIYIGEENVRFLKGLSTRVEAGEKVAIIPAVAGGSR